MSVLISQNWRFYLKFRNSVLLVLITIAKSQSPYNAIGHGIIMDVPDAASVGISSSGLLPSLNNSFSPSNPTTWTDLSFTYLTGHYNNQNIATDAYKSIFGTLSNATFILPIRGKYAFGMGITPISRKTFNIAGDTTSIVFSGDTLNVSKQLNGTGGISSMFFSGASNFVNNHTIGMRMDFLFGIYDELNVSNIDFRSSNYARRFRYKGTYFSAYYRFLSDPKNHHFSLFSSLQFPVGYHYITRTDFFEFLDPISRPKTDFLLPINISFGGNYKLLSSLYASAEILMRSFNSKFNNDINSIYGEIGKANRISLGLTKEKVIGSREFFDLFHYRVGFFRRSHYIRGLQSDLTELGFSLGLGIPFGLTQNQLDFGLRISKREGFLSKSTETITHISVGLTVGDLWLIKGKRR